MHLDAWRGTLEFYLNRKPLGVAFTNLRGKTVFPVICSTAAKSSLTLSTARSLPSSLQFLAVRSLAHKLPGSTLLSLLLPPGIRNFIRNNYWFFIDHSSVPTSFYAPVTPCISTSSGSLRTVVPDQLGKKGGEETETEDEDCFLVTPEGRKEAKEALMAKCVALGEQNKRGRTSQKVKKNVEGINSKAVDKNLLEKEKMGTDETKKMAMPVGEGETTEEEETPPRNIKRSLFSLAHPPLMKLLPGSDYALQGSEDQCIVKCFVGSKNCLCCYIIVRIQQYSVPVCEVFLLRNKFHRP